jgi:hypothetical protein
MCSCTPLAHEHMSPCGGWGMWCLVLVGVASRTSTANSRTGELNRQVNELTLSQKETTNTAAECTQVLLIVHTKF